jgi:hypothetical protein
MDFRWLGAGFYASFLFIILVRKFARGVLAMLSFGAGIHGSLLFILYRTGLFCLPCLLAGLSICFVFVFVALRLRKQLVEMLLCAALGVIVCATLISFGELHGRHQMNAALTQAIQGARASLGALAEGPVVFIYSSESCFACQQLRTHDVPKIHDEFGTNIAMVISEARILNLPTPTIIIFPNPPTVFPGRPNYSELRGAVLGATSRATISGK